MVERLARVRHERGRDRHRDAVGLDLEEDRARHVPGGVAAGLERGADPARREGARVRLALQQVLARELGDGPPIAGRVQERVVLLGGRTGHRHEPVRVVGGAARHRPLLHAVGDRIHDRRVERLVAVDRPAQLLEDRLGQELALGILVEDVLAVDLLAGELEVVLRGGDLVAGDGGDGGLTCGHGSPVGACGGRLRRRLVQSAQGMTLRGDRSRLRYQPPRLRVSTLVRCHLVHLAQAVRPVPARSGARDRPGPSHRPTRAARPGTPRCSGGRRVGPPHRRCWPSPSTARSVASRSRWAAARPVRIGASSSRASRTPSGRLCRLPSNRYAGRRAARSTSGAGSRPLPASSVSRAAASAAGREPGLDERTRHGDRPTDELGHRPRGREALGVVGRGGRHESQFEALGRPAQGRPARPAGAGAGRHATASRVSMASRAPPALSGEQDDPWRTFRGQRVGPAGLLARLADGIGAGQLERQQRHDPFARDALAFVGGSAPSRTRAPPPVASSAGAGISMRSATFEGRAR